MTTALPSRPALSPSGERALRAPDPPGLITMDGVDAEHVRWLWPGRLPLGKLVVIDGDPSTGKSTLTLDLCRPVTTGEPWPDGAAGPTPGGVLLLSAEDGLADTIAPRLDAAGVDRSRVHALVSVEVPGEDKPRLVPPSLPRDIPVMEAYVRRFGVRLVVVDVLMAYLAGGVDSHRDQDVRAVLHQLAAMAERTGCCVVLIRHMNKGAGGNALYRGNGSIGIIGAARAAFLVARDPDDNDRRIFAVTKLNIAAEPPTLAYRLVSADDLGVARIAWETDPVAMSAAELLRGPGDPEERTERDEAADWLADWLEMQGGTAPSKDAKAAARKDGHTERTLKRAMQHLGIVVTTAGFPKRSWWALPESAVRPDGPHPETVAPLENSGPTARTHPSQATHGPTVGPTVLTSANNPPQPPTFPVGPRCDVCGDPMVDLSDGHTTHPNCTRDAA